MLTLVESLLQPLVSERALLLLNHVLAAEPVATARLKPHAGSVLKLEWQIPPGPWPRPPEPALRVTPAGLFEAADAATEPGAALRVRVELPSPPRALELWLAGERPALTIDGDVRLAADIAWLADNLRWDAEHDLARVLGDAPAHELLRLAGGLRDALRAAAHNLGATRDRRPGGGAAASR